MIRAIIEKLETLGEYFVFTGKVLRSITKKPIYLSQYMSETENIGINSLLIIILSSAAMGMILALQMASILIDFQAEIGTGAAVAIAMSREIAPVITTLMLIAKNGSAMAAELGTMKVTEQIDALEAMSISLEQYLVLPKVIACFLIFPALTLLANMVGTAGAYVVSVFFFGVESGGYLNYLFDFLSPRDIFAGLIKACVFALIVSTICCFYGLRTTQGAKGVGNSSTKAVVASSISILVADYLLATILLRFIYQ